MITIMEHDIAERGMSDNSPREDLYIDPAPDTADHAHNLHTKTKS